MKKSKKERRKNTINEWCNQEGDVVPICKMDSRHLYNSIRMVFNNTAPEEFRIPGGNSYADIKTWSKNHCYKIIQTMIAELETRIDSSLSEFFSDLTQEEWSQIRAIKVYNEMRMI